MSDLDKAKDAVKQSKERGKSKRTEYRNKQKAAARRANTHTIWAPQYREDGAPGPQVALVTCPDDINEILFGGARGGGKTFGALGAWLLHANKYGQHAKGVFFRRRFKQLEDVQNQCAILFPKVGATFNKGEAVWVFPSGATLKLRHLWDEHACEEYQGHQYCVAKGTPVLMGDGTHRPIEEIAVGDLVMTLEGPKPVTATMAPRVSPCVKVQVFDASGELLGEQIHPEDHPVLTTVSQQIPSLLSNGPEFSQSLDTHVLAEASVLRPGDCQDLSFLDTEDQRPSAQALDTGSPYSSRTSPPQRRYPAQWQSYTTLLDAHRESLGSSACPEDGQSGCTLSEGGPQVHQPLPLLSCPIVLFGPDLQSDPLGLPTSTRSHKPDTPSELCAAHIPSHASTSSGQQQLFGQLQRSPDCDTEHLASDGVAYETLDLETASSSLENCSSDLHRCDEQLPCVSGIGQSSAPSQDGAEERTRTYSDLDGLEPSPQYSHQDELGYVHPYSYEYRKITEEYRTGLLVLEPCEPRVVYDLTVADSNHYVTKFGIINCNTFLVFEELTNWPSSAPMNKMRATLRNAYGVPSKIICTANPGGVGHNWVKLRYISPQPKGFMPIVDAESGEKRVYIPSRLEDNRALFENDPNYERRLLQSGNAALVKAWRWGDWDIVAGGAMDDLWDPDKHLLQPFVIPSGWRFRRSFDWGSAAPASLGIWAISDGSPVRELDGMVFPRGSLIRIDEWYTVATDASGNVRPNEGLRLTNIALGNGLGHRAQGRSFSGCVADPAIFSQHGRQSIYSEMQIGAREVGHNLVFNMADNNRVAGWQKMRDMLENAAQDIPEKPGLYAFETCVNYARTIPVLQRDESKPDDIDTDQEDHIADDTRYACMTGGRGVVEGSITGH